MECKPLRLGVIGGFGHAGDVLSELEGAEALVEVIGWAPAYESEMFPSFMPPDTQRFTDLGQLLARKPEWVVVSTRLDRIADVSMKCLESGAHVIAEKPLALDLSKLSELYSVWQESQRFIDSMFTMENEPAFLAAHDLVHSGLLGRIMLGEARKSYRWGKRPTWFGDPRFFGGTFPWIGIHAFNILYFITGEKFVHGFSRQANLAHDSFPACQDVCTAILTLQEGAQASVCVDLARPDSALTHGDDWCRIVGSLGTLEANASEGWCRVCLEGEPARTITLPPRGRRFLRAMQRVSENDLCKNQSKRAFHLTEVSLLARDYASSEKGFHLDRRAEAELKEI